MNFLYLRKMIKKDRFDRTYRHVYSQFSKDDGIYSLADLGLLLCYFAGIEKKFVFGRGRNKKNKRGLDRVDSKTLESIRSGEYRVRFRRVSEERADNLYRHLDFLARHGVDSRQVNEKLETARDNVNEWKTDKGKYEACKGDSDPSLCEAVYRIIVNKGLTNEVLEDIALTFNKIIEESTSDQDGAEQYSRLVHELKSSTS